MRVFYKKKVMGGKERKKEFEKEGDKKLERIKNIYILGKEGRRRRKGWGRRKD